LDSIPHKTCTRCKQPKPLAEFYANPRYKDGHMTWCKLCHKAYRDANREKRNAQMKAWADAHREQQRVYHRAYYQTRDEFRQRRQQARRERDRYRWAAEPAYRERKNRQKAESLSRRADDPIFRRKRAGWRYVANQRRRARLAAAPGNHTSAEWRALCRVYGGRCACCGKKAELTADHIVPLSRGGSNDIANIQPLCKLCNSKKHTKTVDYRQVVQLGMDL
jgi:5-methylcytosine-specific restriction endonuclease McrA